MAMSVVTQVNGQAEGLVIGDQLELKLFGSMTPVVKARAPTALLKQILAIAVALQDGILLADATQYVNDNTEDVV